jgi:hypothetical protein
MKRPLVLAQLSDEVIQPFGIHPFTGILLPQ